MGIVEDYILITGDAQQEYGENTVLLMQVGSFFEIYGLRDAKGNITGSKIVDVAKFLKLFEVCREGVMVFCKVLPAGTIRPDEILELLDMSPSEISTSVVRKQIHWQIDT